MSSTLGPDAHPAIGVLYASREPLAVAADGVAIVVSHAAAAATRGTLCAVLSFPALADFPASAESTRLLASITNYVKESYYQSSARGLSALQAVMEGLHLYVQFLNDSSLQTRPITGAVTLAEVKDSMLYVVYSSHTLHIVAKYGEADTFPAPRREADFLIGSPGKPRMRSYQAELNPKGLFFQGTDAWYLSRATVPAQNVLRQELAQAVAGAVDEAGKVDVLPFERRNPDRQMPGLLMGFPPMAQTAARQGRYTFVAPEERGEAVPAEAEPAEAPEPAKEETRPPAAAEAQLELQSALETLEPGRTRVPHIVRKAARSTGNRLTRWVSEVFPDPQVDTAAPVAPVAPPVLPPEPQIPAAPVGDRAAADRPSRETAASASEAYSLNQVLRRVQNRYEANLEGQSRQSGPPKRPWAGMTLLLLLIVVPLATWIAYAVGDIPAASDVHSMVETTQRHLDAARAFLLQEQWEPAQQELQLARHLIQSHRDLGGLTPQSKVLQHELDALWLDAFKIVPLIGLTVPLLTFGRDEQPEKVIVNIQNLFLLMENRGSQVVKYRLDLMDAGERNQRQMVLREGDLVEGVRVGRIVDMAFQPTKTAYSDKPSLYMLDEQRNIFQYNDTDHVSVVDLGQQSAWEKPLLIDFYSNRMYVADAGPGQIWRYDLNSANVQQEAWLAEPTNLNPAIRMHVDTQIWLLLDNNSIVVYGSDGDLVNPVNVQKPFALHSAIALESQFVDLETGSQQSNYLLVPDPGQKSILVLDKETGDFLYQLAAPEGIGSDFDRLRDVNLHRDQLYILTDTSLYRHSFAP